MPTTAAARVDLSAEGASTSAYPESDHMWVPFVRSLPCSCGGTVTADLECPGAGIREHQASAQHAAWRQRHGL